MNDKIYFNNLYDYYGELLTDKQRSYFEDYYFEDYSLSEIADNKGVSRNAVHHQLKQVEEKLKYYEETLHLYEKRIKIKELLTKIEDKKLIEEIEKII